MRRDLTQPQGVWDDDVQRGAHVYFQVVEEDTRSQRRSAVGIALAVWLLPSLTLYAFGWIVGWVYRGFKPKTTQ